MRNRIHDGQREGPHRLLYEYDKGVTAAAAGRSIRQVYGDDAVDDSTCRRWFRKFRDGDRSCTDHGRSGRPSLVTEEDLDTAITTSPHATVEELADRFSVHRTTVERRMHALGFITKFDQWVPHHLTARQREERISSCVSLLSRNRREPFLDRMVTGDEKWVLYRNVKRRRTVCRVAEATPSTSTGGLHPAKVMLSVWWDVHGIIHWEVLAPNQSINADLYCQQLDRLRAQLTSKRPALINRRRVLFHHDNARPHVALRTHAAKITGTWVGSFTLPGVFPRPCTFGLSPVPIVTQRLRSPILQ